MSILSSQRHLFPEKAVAGYLNGASRSPQLKAVAAAARHAIWWREENAGMPVPAFFNDVQEIRRTFAKLINCPDHERVAMMPSTSYGIATAAKNVPVGKGQNIIIVEDQFPSNYYAWAEKCGETGAELRIVARPEPTSSDTWNDRVLAAIDVKTAAVAIANIHWADGTLFDLVSLRRRTDEVDAWLIVDATQSVGAMPTDVQKIRPDVLACGGYKWLMGPYGCGYAYFGERMDDGKPIEDNWINRAGSEDFRNLINYRDEYRPLAGRYAVGQHSNFLMAPMQLAGLQQVNAWEPASLQKYCADLWAGVEAELRELGVAIPVLRAQHLVGLRLPGGVDHDKFAAELKRRGLMVSFRGDAVRVSPSVYNTTGEMEGMVAAIREAL